MNKVIIPLDGMQLIQACELTAKLRDFIWGVKINDLFFRYGIQAINELKAMDVKVMVDAKLFDIPNTMQNTLNELWNADADLVTVHCASQYEARNYERNQLVGVTVLTSFDDSDCMEVFSNDVIHTVTKLMELAIRSQYKNVVCSAKDLEAIRDSIQAPLVTGDYFQKICPGIRPEWYIKEDDQKRVMTPGRAIKAGADLLVIGRPITKALDPLEALHQTNDEIGSVS